jgi:NAD(P)-dependent dehydrogenase (short-subunit alcohol dehydrogenase family)
VSGELSVDLVGRRVLVTGAAGGIGSAVCRRLEDSGASVVAVDVAATNGIAACDVTSEEQVHAAFAGAGALTDVVHTAAIVTESPVVETELETFERIVKVNLTGTFVVAREAARTLPDGGSIVLLGSVGSLTGDPWFGAYCAAKFGVVGLTQVLARELGHRRIRVNAVCPGGVKTSFSDGTIRRDAARLGRSEAVLRELYEADSFANRWATPDEVAQACLYLLSSAAGYVSGHSLVLNGGGNLSSHR